MSGAFALGLQLASPVVVFSIVFNVASGLIGRLMPQFQLFFAAAPLTVLLGLSVFMMSIGMIGMVWLERYRSISASSSRDRARWPIPIRIPKQKNQQASGYPKPAARANVPKSTDLPQWASLAASAAVVFLCGGWMAQNLMNDLVPFNRPCRRLHPAEQRRGSRWGGWPWPRSCRSSWR
ncbi:MAG: flagellar biosynthetic protein FliR [Caulobacteraceae bacterium]